MVTTLLHTADTHIGYQQYHLRERERDFRDAFEVVIGAAIENDVDGVVHAGDLFHKSRPSVSSLSFVIDNLKRLRDNDIEFYVIAGNHDGTREQQWPELFENIGLATYLDANGDVIDGDVALYGMDYVPPGKRGSLTYEFGEVSENVEHRVFVGHGLFEPFPYGDWDLSRVLSRSTVSFDAALLGDDHKHQVEVVDGVVATYAGSTERTAADQREPRGYNIVEFGRGGVDVSHEDIPTRDFVYVDVELDGDDGVEVVRDELAKAPVSSDSVVIVTLTGGGSRIPSAVIEQSASVSDVLRVQVNDRREFADADVEYEEVAFSDPDDAVRERKSELGLSDVGSDLEEVARDLEGVPETHLKDKAESMAESVLEEKGVTALEGTQQPDDETPDGENTDTGEDEADDDDGDGDGDGTEQLTIGDTQ